MNTQSEKLDNEIFSILLDIYKKENNTGKNLFSFNEYVLERLLSKKAFKRLKSDKSTLGIIRLYGGSLGQYKALNIANGDFYKRLRELNNNN